MFARAGLVTYSGPHWSSFGMRDHFQQTFDWFRMAVMTNQPIEPSPAQEWTDDLWFIDQDNRVLMPFDRRWTLRNGTAKGVIVGGNLCTLNLLQGTPWMPQVKDAVLFLEDEELSSPSTFARDLTSLLEAIDPAQLRGLIIGRFQRASGMTTPLLEEILRRQPLRSNTSVLANVDFGHTSPQITIPLGGTASHLVSGDETRLSFHSN